MAKFVPWQPVKYQPADATAIRMLFEGTADSAMQKRALKWIIEEACGTYQQSFIPDDDGRRNTDFMLGRIFAGQQIVKMTKLNANALIKPEGDK